MKIMASAAQGLTHWELPVSRIHASNSLSRLLYHQVASAHHTWKGATPYFAQTWLQASSAPASLFLPRVPCPSATPQAPDHKAQLPVCTDVHTQQLGRKLAPDTWAVDPNCHFLGQVTYPF